MKKILLASQYKTLLQKYSNLLVNWDFKIFTTASGSEALRLHNEHKFDLIISDFELEGMGMSTFCSLLRKEENRLPVPIIITCHNVPERIERARQIGACAIVIKPVDPVKLLETIGNQVGLNLIRGKRVELEVAVKIKKGGRAFTCLSRDISNSGILIKSDYALSIGERISCRFMLPGFNCQIETEGEIVRYMTDLECDNLYGISFISISSSHQKTIIDYVNSPANTNSIYMARQTDIPKPDKKHAIELMAQLPGKE